jgi:hypothetical protein
MTLVEWIQHALTNLAQRISDYDKTINPPEIAAAEALPGWKGYIETDRTNTKISLAKMRKEQKGAAPTNWEEINRNKLIDIKEYFTDMEKFLLERGAKPWSVLYPETISTAADTKINQFGTFNAHPVFGSKTDSEIQYLRFTGSWNQEPVPAYLNALYDELFEACFTGANEKIQELCLPAAKPKKDATLLQIAVAVADEGGNRYSRSGFFFPPFDVNFKLT